MIRKRFVEYFLTPKNVVIRSLSCTKMCQGVRVYSSKIAILNNNIVEVIDQKTGKVIDSNLEDVFFFPTGESIKKYKTKDYWEFIEKKGEIICQATTVKVLSNNHLLIKNINNQWKLYVLCKQGHLQQRNVSLDTNIIDVDCLFQNNNFILALKYQNKIILQQRSNLNANIISEIELKDYNDLKHGYISASLSQKLIFLGDINGCQISIPQHKEKLFLYDVEHDFKLLHDDLDEVLVFNNGTYLVKQENTWGFYSKRERIISNLHFYRIEVTERGEILTKEKKENLGLKKIGQYNDEFVILAIDGDTIVCDGKNVFYLYDICDLNTVVI